jgi:hypothetical protein
LSASVNEVAVRAADGATVRFTKDGAGVWQPPAGVTTRLASGRNRLGDAESRPFDVPV